MTPLELQEYLDELKAASSPGLYVPRRFTAASTEGGAEPDLAFQFRGALRDREPGLEELLSHPRVVVLGEPGAGKSVVARAAVRAHIASNNRVPVFSELKGYRASSGLLELLSTSAPAELLTPDTEIGGRRLLRAFILDGVDEIPHEDLAAFGNELEKLLAEDKDATVLLTARQAFYVSNRLSLPQFPSIFHILDFSDEDIREYVAKFGADYGGFLVAVRLVDAEDEIRNPFVLSVMLELFSKTGGLGKLRSENLSFIVDRLIQSRLLINQHKQRRALCMLAVAMETYCRNELTESEALEIIKQSMPIAAREAAQLLEELYGSILRRTTNGFAFQMRSYGEYLAAEALENDEVGKLRELAFVDYDTPNESWMNCVSYLAELNAGVRRLFVRRYPLWMLGSSPTAFSEDEKDQIVRGVLATVAGEGKYIFGRPGVNVRRLGRFLTQATEAELLEGLNSPEAPVRANSILLLSWSHRHNLRADALSIVKDRALAESLRLCAMFALINSSDSSLVPELIAFLDKTDAMYTNILDAIGALCDESQLMTVLPLIFKAHEMLSNAFYRFHEFTSREALLQILSYFATNPEELTTIRSEGYVEPIIKLIPRYFDHDVATICAEIIKGIDRHTIFLSQAGIGLKLFELVSDADEEGLCATLYLEQIVGDVEQGEKRFYYSDQLVASLMKPKTANWLIERHATKTIQDLARYLGREMRDMLRAHSDGWIDELEKNTKAYEAKRAEEQESRDYQISLLQEKLLAENDFNRALNVFHQLTKSHWPELPMLYREWIAQETSNLMNKLDLESSSHWTENMVTYPRVLPLLLQLIERYELKIDPDVPMVFCTTIWYDAQIANYYRRFGFSEKALEKLTQLITTPKSSRALNGTVAFVRTSNIWSQAIAAALKSVVVGNAEPQCQAEALRLLGSHDMDVEFLDEVARSGTSMELRQAAFLPLVELQHRPTIERALWELLSDDDALKAGEKYPPIDMPHSWIQVSVRF